MASMAAVICLCCRVSRVALVHLRWHPLAGMLRVGRRCGAIRLMEPMFTMRVVRRCVVAARWRGCISQMLMLLRCSWRAHHGPSRWCISRWFLL